MVSRTLNQISNGVIHSAGEVFYAIGKLFQPAGNPFAYV
jgi:hypothetical protein